MARSKDDDAAWETHRHELKAMFLDQRLTVEQIRQHMSQKYNFSKSQHQYHRQFKKWHFKKNLTDDDWCFVAHRREKRKREGKDPGPVSLNGTLIPEAKVRKEISRHLLPTTQYLDTVHHDDEPATPEGITVGTPRSEMQSIACHPSLPSPQMNWTLNIPEVGTVPDFEFPDIFPINDDMYDQLVIELPELPGIDTSQIPVFDNQTGYSSNHEGSTRKPDASRNPALNPAHTGSSHCSLEPINKDILEGTGWLFGELVSNPAPNINDLSEHLEPVTMENVHRELIGKAENIFQTDTSSNLSSYLSLCVYLSSNNLLPSPLAMDRLVMLLEKSNAHLRLETLLQPQNTTTEIFLSDLLASTAKLGKTDMTRIIINYGADLDATRGQYMRVTPLSLAIAAGHVECVRVLLEAGADPNLASEEKTPLQIACTQKNGSIVIVELLLKSGAHISPPQDSARLTALQLAASNCRADVVRLLLQWKADPNTFTTSKGGTALQIACSLSSNAEIPELLINAKANIDTCSGHKYSDEDSDSEPDFDLIVNDFDLGSLFCFEPAILIAADNENWETVQLLLEEGAAANPNMSMFPIQALKEEFNFNTLESPVVLTPLQAAVRAENITMTRMLLSAGAHVDARPNSEYGHTALQIAAMMGNKRLVQILLRKGADINAAAGAFDGLTALQAAACHSDTELLTFLLNEGADVNASPSSENGKSALQAAIAQENVDAVKILLDAGARVNIGKNCEDPLVLRKCIKITDTVVRDEAFSLLLRAGAQGEFSAGQGEYASLLFAVSREDVDMTRRLLKRGANPNAGYCQHTKRTLLQEASYLGNEALVRLLISHRADINAPAHFRGVFTALQSAALQNHLKIVKFLLHSGADARAAKAKYSGDSAIEAAVFTCDEELIQAFLDHDPEILLYNPLTKRDALGNVLHNWRCTASLVRLLLKSKVDVNMPSGLSWKKPYLQIAVERGGFETVQCLLAAGADVNRRWSPGNKASRVTALQAAVFSRNIDIVQILIEWGADVNAPAHTYTGGQTALQIAVSQNDFEMIQILVQNGADIDGAPGLQGGLTALQTAASKGYLKLTQYLLQKKADVNVPAAHFGGMTALQGAAIKGNIRIVVMLLAAGADIGAAPAIENGRSAIEGAAENGRLDTLHLLLNYHPDTEEFEIKKKRASKLALANGHLAIGRFLMAYRKRASK